MKICTKFYNIFLILYYMKYYIRFLHTFSKKKNICLSMSIFEYFLLIYNVGYVKKLLNYKKFIVLETKQK